MATFNNCETFERNIFLSVNNHDADCFCLPCRNRKIGHISVVYQQNFPQLRQQVVKNIPNERQARCDAVFETTKRQIILGKLYHDECLAGTRYKRFKWWAKNQPYYRPYVEGEKKKKKEFDNHCGLVNDCVNVFDDWEKIVGNLTDSRIRYIDARSFSVDYFCRARSIHWCIEYDAKLSRGGKKSEKNLYTRADIDGIFQHIVSTGILDDVDATEAASIGQQIQRRCVSYALRHGPPP